jgi:hypothetical protein
MLSAFAAIIRSTRSLGVSLSQRCVLNDDIAWSVAIVAGPHHIDRLGIDIDDPNDLPEGVLLDIGDIESNIGVAQTLDAADILDLFELLFGFSGFELFQGFVVNGHGASAPDLFQFDDLPVEGIEAFLVDFLAFLLLFLDLDRQFSEAVGQTTFGHAAGFALFLHGEGERDWVHESAGWALFDGVFVDVGFACCFGCYEPVGA